MKKHCPYWLTPNGIRISKRSIKRMPLLAEEDSIAGVLDPSLLSNPPQINSGSSITGHPQPKRRLEVIDFTGSKEAGSDDN